MSTDQVFDGETGGYTETSTTGPLNLYGRLKAEMEGYVLATINSIVARTGWNVGWQPDQHCAVSQCYETLLKPGARMAHDNFFNLTDVDDTARGLLALATSGSPTHRIYHLVSASETSRIELARNDQSGKPLGSDHELRNRSVCIDSLQRATAGPRLPPQRKPLPAFVSFEAATRYHPAQSRPHRPLADRSRHKAAMFQHFTRNPSEKRVLSENPALRILYRDERSRHERHSKTWADARLDRR